MTNQEIQAAQDYHAATKLSYINLRNKPPLHKSYPGLPAIPLPTEFSPPVAPTLDAVSALDLAGGPALDLLTLAQLLYFSAGMVRKAVFPASGEVHFRAAASAGALYPVEVYLVCKNIPGLEAGVYHFAPAEFALRRLRKGDYRAELSSAAAEDKAISTAPVTFIFTAMFWRSAWKYGARSYRYCFWDNGTILANLLATASAVSLPARLLVGFVDDRVNLLLDVHEEREASLCLVPIGTPDNAQPGSCSLDMGPATAAAVDIFAHQLDHPVMRQLHAASKLTTEAEVRDWRGAVKLRPHHGVGPIYPLQAVGDSAVDSAGVGKVIAGRGSTRRFARVPISARQFGGILESSTRGVPADFLGPDGPSLLDIYIIVNDVAGLPSGAYFFSPTRRALELLRDGSLREEAGHLCFEQALGADASAVVFFMADLGGVLARHGNRGYRAAQLEAGILGGRIYLCAHSLGLGASGLTFYDEDVADFFSPHAEGKSCMFVVALGVKAERNRVRPFRSRVGVLLDAQARGAVKGENYSREGDI